MALQQCRADEEDVLTMHGFEAPDVQSSLHRDMYSLFRLVGTSIQIDVRLVKALAWRSRM